MTKTMTANKVCPTCKGSGKQTIIARELTAKGWRDVPSVTMKCFTCNGVGEVTPERQEQIDYEASLWCRCKGDTGTQFHDDGEHPLCSKHCYTCVVCGKIKQIG